MSGISTNVHQVVATDTEVRLEFGANETVREVITLQPQEAWTLLEVLKGVLEKRFGTTSATQTE